MLGSLVFVRWFRVYFVVTFFFQLWFRESWGTPTLKGHPEQSGISETTGTQDKRSGNKEL